MEGSIVRHLSVGRFRTGPLGRCVTFLSLVIGCHKAADGSMVLRAFPSMNCDEVRGRIATGVAGIVLYCFGIPLLALALLVLYHRRAFKSSLSYFLVRAIFSGHNATLTGMAYRIWTLVRTFVFTAISVGELSHVAQALGIMLLAVVSLLFASLADPRTTQFMSFLSCLEEVAVCMVVCAGLWQTGTQSNAKLSVLDLHLCELCMLCVWVCGRACQEVLLGDVLSVPS